METAIRMPSLLEAQFHDQSLINFPFNSTPVLVKLAQAKSGNIARKKKFSYEEDEKLTDFVKKFGVKKWSFAAKLLKGRTPRQCRERWFKYLSPNVGKNSWQSSEDKLLFELVSKHGPRWSHISKYMTGHNETQIKNRYTFLQAHKNHLNEGNHNNEQNSNLKQKSESYSKDSTSSKESGVDTGNTKPIEFDEKMEPSDDIDEIYFKENQFLGLDESEDEFGNLRMNFPLLGQTLVEW